MSIGTVSASRGQALVPGRPGHPTPTGVFTILEKEVHHTSSIYKGAEMPYMERVTWGGIALHAGDLPGYPDSHGCVRLPLEFSKLLFGVTMKGATVILANQHSAPATTVHPGLFFSKSGEESEPIAAPLRDHRVNRSVGVLRHGGISAYHREQESAVRQSA